MRKFIRKNKLNILVTLLSATVLLSVIVVGQAKTRKEAEKLKAVLSQVEQERKAAKETVKPEETKQSETKIEEKEKETEKEKLVYKGVSAVGNVDNSRWKNKNWYVLGDNITAANGYQNTVKYTCSMKNAITDASIGRLMKDTASSVTSDKIKDVDLITVFSGTSDYSLSTPLGTIEDDETVNTFYGSVHKTISTLLKAKPEASIVFFTPIKRGAYKTYPVYPNPNAAGVKLEDYVKAIKEVCAAYKIPVYDLFEESGINESNLKSYTTDNLNLNKSGYSRISKLMADYLKKLN